MRWPIALALTLSLTGVASAQDSSPYQKPQTLVRLPDGRKLNLYCLGEGAPTVMLESGLGGASNVWIRVQTEIAKTTRVCAYDRAGYGFSDAGPMPRDANHVAADFKALLAAAQVRTPVIIVAHSLGGHFARQFANLNPADVAGMVLIDVNTNGADPASKSGTTSDQLDDMSTRCIRAVAAGEMKPGGAMFEACGGHTDTNVAMAQAVLSELDSPSGAQVAASQRSYGDTPLVVLTAGRADTPADRATSKAYFDGHEKIAALSSRSVHRTVAGAQHMIQFDKPAAVIEAVNDVVTQVRAKCRAYSSLSAVIAPMIRRWRVSGVLAAPIGRTCRCLAL